MNTNLRVGILGAGLGSRMQTMSKAKPLAKLGKSSLLERLLQQIHLAQPEDIYCALRDELLHSDDKKSLPQGTRYIFVNTESSLHTLKELILAMGTKKSILFTMADTIIKPEDFRAFAAYCRDLPSNSNAVLVTPFVDDEKPLWVQVDSLGSVTNFGATPGPYVTSGMYFLSAQSMQIALEKVDQGVEKMRNFLSALIEAQVPIKTFVVSKTIDVDHPSDLEKAEEFLHSD